MIKTTSKSAINVLYPLRFRPVYKDYIWGGDRIVKAFHRAEPPGIYAESWEVSDHADGMSLVANGPLAGRSLHELVERLGADLLGRKIRSAVFPLLIKLIDAREKLSVQVHPNDETAKKYGGEAKTEMWYILDAQPGARVFAGLRPGVTKKAFERAIESSTLEEVLVSVPVSSGDAIFMPGGRVHAIDAGCLILEVQQNSNTTYRVYDWGRVGADGKSRPLHIKQALQVMTWNDPASAKIKPRRTRAEGKNEFWEVLSSPYFRMDRCVLAEPFKIQGDGRSFTVVFIASGRASVESESVSEMAVPGMTYLIPAGLKECAIVPRSGKCEILKVTVP